jgi:hypothetical protein
MFKNRKPTSLDELFPQDIMDYYVTFQAYIDLNTENYTEADRLARKSLALADRWNELAADAEKIATDGGFKKTTIATYCLNKFSTMKKIHDHCRMIWNHGEDNVQRNNY